MGTAYISEYADITVTFSKVAQCPAEPCIADQTPVTTSGSHAESAAFNANTHMISISTPSGGAVCVAFGVTPTATTNNKRLPGNGLYFFGVRPGDKVSLIDVT